MIYEIATCRQDQIKTFDDVRKSLLFRIYVDTDIEIWRANTFWEKEPETLAWIDSMRPGEILYDIGANIGIYTLYAAARGIQVVAVEPVLENYMRLVQNIELNHFKNVIPIYGACGYHIPNEIFDELFIENITIGASGSQLKTEAWANTTTLGGRLRKVPLYNLDDLSSALGLHHDHIKVDVDGQEKKIVLGFYGIFYTKSVLVEINPEAWPIEEAIRIMSNFRMVPDTQFNLMSPHSSERRQKEGIKAVNMVFVKA